MPRTLIGAKVEKKAATILRRAAKKSKQTVSAYSAVVLEKHANSLPKTQRRSKSNGKE